MKLGPNQGVGSNSGEELWTCRLFPTPDYTQIRFIAVWDKWRTMTTSIGKLEFICTYIIPPSLCFNLILDTPPPSLSLSNCSFNLRKLMLNDSQRKRKLYPPIIFQILVYKNLTFPKKGAISARKKFRQKNHSFNLLVFCEQLTCLM